MYGIAPPGPVAPSRAWPVELEDGRLGVEWVDGEYRVPDPSGDVLPPFVALASPMEEAEQSEAVARFVERFGPLGLCDVHGRYYHDPMHDRSACSLVRPEPVSLWMDYAHRVRWARTFAEAVAVAEREGCSVGEALEEIWTERGWRRYRAVVEVEREGRGPDPAGEWWAKARLAENRLHLLDSYSTDSDAGWELVSGLIGLSAFPTRMVPRAGADGIHLMLEPSGLLGRVLLELATEVTGAGALAWCDECGQPHTRERAPKRGQGCFCSDRCRKRAWARRQRQA